MLTLTLTLKAYSNITSSQVSNAVFLDGRHQTSLHTFF